MKLRFCVYHHPAGLVKLECLDQIMRFSETFRIDLDYLAIRNIIFALPHPMEIKVFQEFRQDFTQEFFVNGKPALFDPVYVSPVYEVKN